MEPSFRAAERPVEGLQSDLRGFLHERSRSLFRAATGGVEENYDRPAAVACTICHSLVSEPIILEGMVLCEEDHGWVLWRNGTFKPSQKDQELEVWKEWKSDRT